MKVGFIGSGKMAEAMIAAFLREGSVKAHELFVCDIEADRRRAMKRRYGINVYSRSDHVVESAEVLFLAVKPQHLDDVLIEIADGIGKKQLVISIAAGKKIAGIESKLVGARVVRVMPNLPCVVGEGMSVFAGGTKASVADRRTALNLLSCFGRVLELPEDQFDAVTAVSGSGPAFFAYLLDCIVEAGVAEGLERKDALLMAEQTMLGTSRLLIEKKTDPRKLIQDVASAKGTTAAGLQILNESAVSRILAQTIRAASRRSKELS